MITSTKLQYSHVPEELTVSPQWVCWDDQDGRKIPINAKTGHPAKSNDPSTWTDFATTCDAAECLKLTGIGYVFTADDGLVGIDLDECINDDGKIAEWALIILSRFETYAEISPSGHGLKLWCKGSIDKGRKKLLSEKFDGSKAPGIEVYSSGRYFTVTGQRWEGLRESTLRQAQSQLDWLLAKFWPERIPEQRQTTPVVRPGASPAASSNGISVLERAKRYLAKISPAISGQDGHKQTLLTTEHLVRGFALSDDDAFTLLAEWNQTCQPPWSESELRHKITEARTKGTAVEFSQHLREETQTSTAGSLTLLDLEPDTDNNWPASLKPEAFHGVAGEFVRQVLPETEADASALLFHFLTYAASMMGLSRYMPVSGTRHHARLFTVAVGNTASGRKGTALDCVSHVMRLVEAQTIEESSDNNLANVLPVERFSETNVVNGLTSGSGLIWQIRDEQERKGIVDPGVSDKRLLIVESELGGVLQVCQRKGNDLSAVLRDLWDGKTLRSLAKQEPAKATHPHGNLIGHITREELRSTLSKVDTLNGFANRILWYCAKRSKLLPDGGNLYAKDFTGLAGRIHEAIEFGKQSGQMRRSDDAGNLWHEAYARLSQPRLGVFGAVTTRAEAQALRLSMLFALLDCSDLIEVAHLKAALACWQYCEDSARWAFGASLGNQVADDLLAALLEVKPGGLSATDISKLFSRNVNAQRIREAIGLLERCGLVRSEKQQVGSGRPSRILYAT